MILWKLSNWWMLHFRYVLVNVFVTGAHGLILVPSIKLFYETAWSVFWKIKISFERLSYGQHSWSNTSQKKKKIDLNLSIICQSHDASLEITNNILEASFFTLRNADIIKIVKLRNLLTELKTFQWLTS